ncbi:MAG: XdhC family aldehyde oxidoreductase maturation factor [Chloroflexota bacterium]
MNDNEYLTGIICGLLDRGSPLVLASIVKQQGSAPRHAGARMVIGADGRSYGTIGGSLLEAGAIEAATSVIAARLSKLIDFDLTGQDTNVPGMICGGTATVLLEYLGATPENIDFFRRLHDAVMDGDDVTLVTLYRAAGNAVSDTRHCLLYHDGKMAGECPLSGADLQNLAAAARGAGSAAVIGIKDWQVVLEPVRKTRKLYCFGAGHVAKPTAHLAALVGFRVVVADNRAEYASTERFPDAHDVRLISDYRRALDGLDIDADSFIVIFTHSHLSDRFVLEQALKTDAGYIGMIASRKKREAVYRALREKGVTPEELARVHSPIGLDIGAETPEEIAVSIVAELIQERSRPAR